MEIKKQIKYESIEAKELTKKEWKQYLKSKDFKFLESMLKAPKGVFTKDMLLEVEIELIHRRQFLYKFIENIKNLFK